MSFGGAFGRQWTDALGVEVEVATSPKFFKGASGLVESGRVDTFMASASWLLRPATSRLRSYVAIGAGAARVTIKDALDAFTSRSTLAAGNIGGGVEAVTHTRIRLVADARYVHSQFGSTSVARLAEEHVAFWRASAGALLRF